jgi:cell division protein FtsB
MRFILIRSRSLAGTIETDYRQEAEIQQERTELEVAKQKQADLEARIKQLEQSQQQTTKQ